MSLIHIENASKYYTMGEETIKALDDVSLDIEVVVQELKKIAISQ